MSSKRALLSAVLAVLVIATPRAAEDLAGRYRCEGTNTGGHPYAGVLDVVEAERGAFHLRWTLAGGEVAYGAALHKGDTLAIAYSANGALGVALYLVKGKTIKGSWHMPGQRGIYSESCTKDKDAVVPEAPPRAAPDVRERV